MDRRTFIRASGTAAACLAAAYPLLVACGRDGGSAATAGLGGLYRTDELVREKHVPAVTLTGRPVRNEMFSVGAEVGRELPHPDTPDHHLRWIDLLFKPDGGAFPVRIGRLAFGAHGLHDGTGTHYRAEFSMRTSLSGELFATTYCNIHGLWYGSHRIEPA